MMTAKNTKIEVGLRFKTFRKLLGLSQQSLAKVLGYAQRTISDWERGRLEIPIQVLITLKQRYGLNIDWLLTGEGEPFLTPKEEPVKKKKTLQAV